MGAEAGGFFEKMVYSHTSNYIRCEALGVLAGLDRERALAAAIDCLGHSDKKVVISACKILAKLNDLEAAPKLKELIDGKPPATVRITAEATLNQLLEKDSA